MQNPQLFLDPGSKMFHPVLVDGEVFLLKRSNMHFCATFEDETGQSQSVAADGYVLLSTLRLVFVASEMGPGFQAFDVPISLIRGEGFKQPVFGSNYLFGAVDRWHVGPTKFKLYFYSGGCGVFLKVFIDLLTKHRSSSVGRDSDFVASAAQGMVQRGIHEAAYIDPSDPTSVFLAQPPGAPVFGACAADDNDNDDNVEMCELVREAPSHSSGVAPRSGGGGNVADESGGSEENAGPQAAEEEEEQEKEEEEEAAEEKVEQRTSTSPSAQADDPEPIVIPSWIAQRQENPVGAGTAQIRRRRVPRYEDYTRPRQ